MDKTEPSQLEFSTEPCPATPYVLIHRAGPGTRLNEVGDTVAGLFRDAAYRRASILAPGAASLGGRAVTGGSLGWRVTPRVSISTRALG